jgi:hypothetical protein
VEHDPGALSRKKRRRRVAAALLLLVALGAGIWWSVRRTADSRSRAPSSVTRVVPEGTRIKIEVLNASDTRGLARIATFVLRDAGFDVVYFGNTNERVDTTVVRDRSGHPEWAELARGAIPPARVETRPDSGRLVDLTVLIGASWRPPLEPFRP